MKRLWTALAITGLAMSGMGSGIFKQHTKPRLLPGVPARDYQQGGAVPTTEARSTKAVLVLGRPNMEAPDGPPGWKIVPPPIVRSRVKYFQLDQAALQIDHCFVSRFALVLREDGVWSINCRADQSPLKKDGVDDVGMLRDQASVRGPQPLFTDHLKRNLFMLRVRCLGTYVDGKMLNNVQGQPLLLRFDPEPFWVQRQQPYDFFCTGRTNDVSRYFDLIEQAEVEFSYR